MSQKQKEQLSSFMDNETYDENLLNEALENKALKQSWARYHLIRDVMQGKLDKNEVFIDVASNIEKIIESESIENHALVNKNRVDNNQKNTVTRQFKFKEVWVKFAQIGLAACVTLAIIVGVQFQQGAQIDDVSPSFNTMPFGVSVMPVGGISEDKNLNDTNSLKELNEKLQFLIQDYEIQKRLLNQTSTD